MVMRVVARPLRLQRLPNSGADGEQGGVADGLDHLTGIRLQFAIYFLFHTRQSPLKGCKMASAFMAL